MSRKRILNSKEVARKYRALKAAIPEDELKQLRYQKLIKGGISSRFQKGHVPWTKDLKGIHLSPKSEFKKGHLPHNHKHTGTIFIRTDKCDKQFRWIKISGLESGKHKWIPYARYLWQKKNGSVPTGFFVVHKDGNTLNDVDSNFILVDRPRHLALQEQQQIEKRLRRIEKEITLETKDKKLVESGLQQLKGNIKVWWECTGCSFESHGKLPPLPCPKCGGLHFEEIGQSEFAQSRTEIEEEVVLI